MEEYIGRRKLPLSTKEYNKTFEITKQLIKALHVIHSDYKIIHRDLSLRNIFIGFDNTIKIGDFGLATKCHHFTPLESSPFLLKLSPILPEEDPDEFSLEEKSTENSQRINNSSEDPSFSSMLTHGLGTKAFAAPEQMSNLPYDQKADIYSLGLILLALLYPTQTLSERSEVLKNCRRHVIPDRKSVV